VTKDTTAVSSITQRPGNTQTPKPDISILSDEILAEVKHLPQRNLAVELLQKLLNNELKIRSKKYLVQSRSFAEMLEATIRKYQNRTIEAAQVIAELIELAKQMREGQKRGQNLGLTDDEVVKAELCTRGIICVQLAAN
jgi:type I restriction enzyme R subunit